MEILLEEKIVVLYNLLTFRILQGMSKYFKKFCFVFLFACEHVCVWGYVLCFVLNSLFRLDREEFDFWVIHNKITKHNTSIPQISGRAEIFPVSVGREKGSEIVDGGLEKGTRRILEDGACRIQWCQESFIFGTAWIHTALPKSCLPLHTFPPILRGLFCLRFWNFYK